MHKKSPTFQTWVVTVSCVMWTCKLTWINVITQRGNVHLIVLFFQVPLIDLSLPLGTHSFMCCGVSGDWFHASLRLNMEPWREAKALSNFEVSATLSFFF